MNIEADLLHRGQSTTLRGRGNGPIDAFMSALGMELRLMDHQSHAIESGAPKASVAYVELRLNDGPTRFGVGVDENMMTASFKAIVSALNRCMMSEGEEEKFTSP